MADPVDLSRLAPPPRTIQPGAAVRILFGSAAAQIGWLVLGFGSIFLWVFVFHADLSGWRFRPGAFAEIRGDALLCRDTHYSEGGTKYRRGTPVYENQYAYEVEGQRYEAASYAVGKCVAGGPVRVEYLLGRPEVSRIAGMRRDVCSPWTSLVALLPGAGLVIVLVSLAKGRTNLRLLRDGQPASARLVGKSPTGSRTNGRMVYQMTFEYTAMSGAAGRATTKTSRPEKFEAGATQTVLYDPADLSRAVLVASLPGRFGTDEAGQPQVTGTAAFILLPALTLLGNGWYAWHHWIAGH